MYTVVTTGQTVKSFTGAIKIASAANSEIVCDKGITRWTPAPAVSEKKMRQYRERTNARKAYEETKG